MSELPNTFRSLDKTSVGSTTIPEEWSVNRLEDLSHESLYGLNESGHDYQEGEPRYIRITDINESSGALKTDGAKSVDPSIVNSRTLKFGDMLFARSGSVGQSYLYNPDDGDCTYGGYLIRYRLDEERILPEYLAQYALSPNYWDWIERVARGGVQKNISAKEFNRLMLPIPPRAEQERIASVLYTVDQNVEALDHRHSDLQELKHALMQDLLTGEVRFGSGEHNSEPWTESPSKSLDETSAKGLPEDWVAARLSSITTDSLYGINESAQKEGGDGMVEYIRVTNLQKYQNGLSGEMKYVSEDKVGDKVLEEDDVVFARSGSVGQTYLIEEQSTRTYGGYMIRYRVDGSKVNPRYLLQYTKSPLYWDWIERVARGGVQKNISTKEYDGLLIPLPPRDEQERIASVLYTVDEMIARTNELRDEYEQLKRGLMQDLLSGQILTPNSLQPTEAVMA